MTSPSLTPIGNPSASNRPQGTDSPPRRRSITAESPLLPPAASVDSFMATSLASPEDKANKLLADTDDYMGQLDDFLANLQELGKQDQVTTQAFKKDPSLRNTFGSPDSMLGLAHLQPGSLESMRPKAPNIPINDAKPLIKAWTARQDELKNRSLFAKLFKKPKPSMLDNISPDMIERVKLLQQLREAGVTSLDDFYVGQMKPTTARPMSEKTEKESLDDSYIDQMKAEMSEKTGEKNLQDFYAEPMKATEARQLPEETDRIESTHDALRQSGVGDADIAAMYKPGGSVYEEFQKMGMNDDAIQALLKKTGVTP